MINKNYTQLALVLLVLGYYLFISLKNEESKFEKEFDELDILVEYLQYQQNGEYRELLCETIFFRNNCNKLRLLKYYS